MLYEVITKGMNLTEPAANLPAEINNATMYLLGSKALSAKLTLLQVSEPVLASRYFEIQQQLKALNSIKILSTEGKAFTYIDEPNEPAKNDKPQRVFILMVGLLLGMILGCSYILFYTSISKIRSGI